jgi:hypothetical protein
VTTWLPIFLAGAGASELRLDEGVGHALPQGTQLMAQLHLLNAGSQDIKQQVEIKMHLSTAANLPIWTASRCLTTAVFRSAAINCGSSARSTSPGAKTLR